MGEGLAPETAIIYIYILYVGISIICKTDPLHRYSKTKLCLCFPYKINQKVASLGLRQILGHYSGTLLLSFNERIHTYVCMYMCLYITCV